MGCSCSNAIDKDTHDNQMQKDTITNINDDYKHQICTELASLMHEDDKTWSKVFDKLYNKTDYVTDSKSSEMDDDAFRSYKRNNFVKRMDEMPGANKLIYDTVLKWYLDLKDIDNIEDEKYCQLNEIYKNKQEEEIYKKQHAAEFNTSSLAERMPISSVWKLAAPKTRYDLELLMQDAVDNGKKIKAMGSRYGFTNITFTDGCLIDMFNGCCNPHLEINKNLLNKHGLSIFNKNNLHFLQIKVIIDEN